MRPVVQPPLPLPVRLSAQDVNRAEVMALTSFCAVMQYTLSRGPWANDKDAARQLGIDPALYSRRRNGEAPWGIDDVGRVMQATASLAPLVWLAGQAGHGLVMLETEAEAQLRAMREQLEGERRERRAVEETPHRMIVGRLA